ncbi:terpene synthase metal-binding domain containing protein [Moelleriella libera RCEF 2490]|uniref:Terpene synthase n=1 Tax=Moelleriella libera RCEF 2490 TaxID=1081109 RepID=A0A166NVZ2_9HYPO|nr:terpene synthase metal-binding domain containing protein [Moelleriella libera RCEF 2490]
MEMDEKQAKNHLAWDFSLLSAGWVPEADAEGLRLLTDWCNWVSIGHDFATCFTKLMVHYTKVFHFDDLFDESSLQRDPFKAAGEIIQTLSILSDVHPPIDRHEHPLRYAFQNIWQRFQKRSSVGETQSQGTRLARNMPGRRLTRVTEQQRRYIEAHRLYMMAVLEQVHLQNTAEYPNIDLEHLMEMRQASIGARPAIALMEGIERIDLPPEVRDHPSLVICERISAECTFLGNDVVSLQREIDCGIEDHNMVFRLTRMHGISLQEALVKLGEMLDDRYKAWDRAVAELPTWDETTDKAVQRLLNVFRRMPLSNAHWSFKCGRYFGANGETVKSTRKMQVVST